MCSLRKRPLGRETDRVRDTEMQRYRDRVRVRVSASAVHLTTYSILPLSNSYLHHLDMNQNGQGDFLNVNSYV